MTIEEILRAHGQEHVLEETDKLTADEKAAFDAQVNAIDWSVFDILAQKGQEEARGEFEPLGAVELPEIQKRHDEFYNAGIEAIKRGEIGAVLLAGGQGTRLGLDGPKGTCEIGLTRSVSIFEQLICNLRKVTDAAGCIIPLYVMTSEKNNDATKAFFQEKNFFGYPKEDVFFFIQEMAVSVDYNGKIYKEGPGRLATSPNGNGGWFSSMMKGGALADAKKRGVKWLNVFAVDNVLQQICDPVFVGATLSGGYDSGAKVVSKADPYEKVGVLCLEDGRPSIVEYYDMGKEMAETLDAEGKLAYRFGVILNYLFSVEKLEDIVARHMPLHIVEKKIPYYTAKDGNVAPTEPNGYKFETLVLDMVHMMDNCLSFEVDREKEFAPIKNLHGVDSLDSARELLQKNGVTL